MADLVKALSGSGTHLGDLCWWSLEGAACSADVLRAAWEAEGLAKDGLPEGMTDRAALGEAGRGVRHEGWLVRPCPDASGRPCLAVVRETRGTDALAHAQEGRCVVDAGACVVSGAAGDAGALEQEIAGGYARLRGTVRADQIRGALVREFVRLNAALVREAGGVYWVPPSGAGTVRSLRRAVARLGSSVLDVLPVHEDGSGEGRASVAPAAQADLASELKRLKTEVSGWKEAGQRPARDATLTSRLEQAMQLKNRAEMYRAALGVEVAGLDEALSDIALDVTNMLTAPPPEADAA